tara:strand:- start:314 stop:1519 length:1206 start_codon:yes stop_codon:yes gene_type:complete
MTIEINLNSFFKNFLDKDQKIHYDNNLKTCKNIGAKIKEEINSNQNEIFNSLTQAYQSKIFSLKNQLDKSKKKLIIGIGGSTAGLKSFTEYTDQNYLFIDNLNYSKINELLSKKDILDYSIYLISKSGNTFETLAALNLLYQHAKKINSLEKLFSKMTCITEESDNNLYNFAKKNNVRLIIHNKKIGGRYSFFSETGILPSNLSETDVATTCKFDDFLGEDFNSAIVNSAIIMTVTKTKMIKKNINLFYDEKLSFFGDWFNQLHAESLGKNNEGLTPLYSICPRDHHSMAQLYLDGPKDNYFTIFPPAENKYFSKFDKLNFTNIENQTPQELINSQYNAIQKVFIEKNIPFRTITIGNNKLNILQLFLYYFLETIILGEAQNINPYDQPAVEEIKIKTIKN